MPRRSRTRWLEPVSVLTLTLCRCAAQEKDALAKEMEDLNSTVFSKSFKAPSAWAEREVKYKMEKRAWEIEARACGPSCALPEPAVKFAVEGPAGPAPSVPCAPPCARACVRIGEWNEQQTPRMCAQERRDDSLHTVYMWRARGGTQAAARLVIG